MPTGPTDAVPSRGSVLIVEDEALIAMDLELLLQRHGWRVLGPAATVAEALRLLEEGETPDLALLDVNLGGELVGPVVEALRARQVPCVLSTAYERVDEIDGRLAGVPNLGKPADERRLLAALVAAGRTGQG